MFLPVGGVLLRPPAERRRLSCGGSPGLLQLLLELAVLLLQLRDAFGESEIVPLDFGDALLLPPDPTPRLLEVLLGLTIHDPPAI